MHVERPVAPARTSTRSSPAPVALDPLSAGMQIVLDTNVLSSPWRRHGRGGRFPARRRFDDRSWGCSRPPPCKAARAARRGPCRAPGPPAGEPPAPGRLVEAPLGTSPSSSTPSATTTPFTRTTIPELVDPGRPQAWVVGLASHRRSLAQPCRQRSCHAGDVLASVQSRPPAAAAMPGRGGMVVRVLPAVTSDARCFGGRTVCPRKPAVADGWRLPIPAAAGIG